MSGCKVSRAERAGRAVYELSGRLDGASAWELRHRLEQERASDVLLDFSQVDDFADYGVAVLAQALDGPRRPRLIGLRLHTVRLFGYFGVDLRGQGRRDAADLGDLAEPGPHLARGGLV